MLKNLSKLEVVIENKVYQLLMDSDSPVTHVKDALTKFIAFAHNFEEMIRQDQERIKAEEEAKKASEIPQVPIVENAPVEPPKE